MDRKIFFASSMLLLSATIVEAQNRGTAVAIWNPTLPISKSSQVRKAQPTPSVTTTYTPASTALTVRFPANSQGGKVEIYRNGARVVSANAAAGSTLCYTLRNYGRGEYMIVVSQGDTVVGNRSVSVK